jgi:hypothetical protein
MRTTMSLSRDELAVMCEALSHYLHGNLALPRYVVDRMRAIELRARLRVRWLALNEIERLSKSDFDT